MEWRKLEVIYWSDILERVHTDSQQLTYSMSCPLLDSLDSNRDEQQKQNLLATLLAWLNSSTLMDFQARLRTGHLLARIVQLKCHDEQLAQKIRSIVSYFERFSCKIDEQFRKDKCEVDDQLKDFIKVVRYQDLNLWSVKQSVKSAHKQIAKLIKRLKVIRGDLT